MPILAPLIFVAALFTGYLGAPSPTPQEPTLSAALPSATPVFETSLAAPITSSATSMTLTANAVRGGGSISGFTCFTLDEGSSQAEYVCGTVSGTAVTSMTRGVSPLTGTTTDSDLQFAHRRGANVKITDFPLIQILKAQNNGEDTFANALSYATASTTIVNPEHVATKAYVDYVAFNGAGVVDASESTRGVVELATQTETASSTAAGGSGNLAIAASTATSTYNSATAALRVPVTGNDGFLDQGFLPATITKNLGISGTISYTGGATTFASTTVYATTSTGVWTKPANLKLVIVEVQGGGGGGGGSTTDNRGAGGGGGGGYCRKVIPASAVGSTETVTVGAAGTAGAATGGTGGTGGTSSFGSHCQATGGTGGTDAAFGVGGDGGASSGGDLNIEGGDGGGGAVDPSGGVFQLSGGGGNSFFGGGGRSVGAPNGSDVAGIAGNIYGGGGSGAATGTGGDTPGGAGAQGVVVITSVFY